MRGDSERERVRRSRSREPRERERKRRRGEEEERDRKQRRGEEEKLMASSSRRGGTRQSAAVRDLLLEDPLERLSNDAS